MEILADESVERGIVDRLRRDLHTVSSVAEMTPGIGDDEVLRRANSVGALLVTGDKDFGELVFRQRTVHAGVVLIRLSGLSEAKKADIVGRAFKDHGSEFTGAFSVVAPGVVRIRHSI